MNYLTNRTLPRRTLLRTGSVSLALPLLESMQSLRASEKVKAPHRFAFIYIPNGVEQETWYPKKTGKDYKMPETLRSLAPLREDFNIITGMDRKFATGTGVHAQAGACWLTSSSPDKPLNGGFPTNVSLDRMIAQKVGMKSMLPSLELSCNDHDNNRETRYFESISWYGPGYAANVLKNPREVFGRLFGKPTGDPAFKSVLDLIQADARRLRSSLPGNDQQKLDEYLDSIRATERRIQNAEKAQSRITKIPLEEPEGIPEHRGEYIQLMGDMILHAFRLDLTRVATFVIDPERWDTPRMYHGIFEKPQNHHVLTHTKGEEALDTLRTIDRFHAEQYAKIIHKFKNTAEGEGSLLDNCLLTMGSGMGNGRIHDYGDLPLLMAGKLGGKIRTGYHFRPKDEPLANLWLSLYKLAGGKSERFADSSGSYNQMLA